MLGSMQTQSAKKFIDSALSLSDETQTEIFNMIQNPITKIQNNEKVTREDILKALKLVDPCVRIESLFSLLLLTFLEITAFFGFF